MKHATDNSASSLSLVSETAVDADDSDLVFTPDDFDNFDAQFKRRLAAAADSDEVNGRSTKLEQRAYHVGQHTLDEFLD